MFAIEMLPAHHGDCLWVEYGSAAHTFRILIDCGTGASYKALKEKINSLPAARRHFELFVVTHVDDDHIGGALKLLEEYRDLGVTFGDVWFNAYPHLEGKAIVSGPDLLGARQGEKLSQLIVDNGLRWNSLFGGRAVVCQEEEDLPSIPLDGGMTLTLLSPYWPQLEMMKTAWENECRKAGLRPGAYVDDQTVDDTLGENVDKLANLKFEPDSAPANGSSIAFMAEFKGTRVLFGADAYAPVLLRSLEKLGHSPDNPLRLDAVKAPHHGSSRNFNRELMLAAPAARMLISTNGDRFQHPDLAAIARMVKFNEAGSTICFNYTTDHNRFWSKPGQQTAHNYAAVYPPDGKEGLRVEL